MVDFKQRIAVIGGGISGITAAYLLGRSNQVTLFEKNDYLGGHTNTRIVEDPLAGPTAIDTGFIVCNGKNYPSFYKLLDEWQVKRRNSEMTFGFYSHESGLHYMGPGVLELIRDPSNLLDRRFLGLIVEQKRFNRRMLMDYKANQIGDLTLRDYLVKVKASQFFIDNYLTPLIAAIWSSPDLTCGEFPAATFAMFFYNHGMLQLHGRPRWQTIVGGSESYLSAFREKFTGDIILKSGVVGLRREKDRVRVLKEDHSYDDFDKVFIATHANEALSLLVDASEDERRLLGSWHYSNNHAVLHCDESVMPPNRRLWAAWNYVRSADATGSAPVAISYYMNALQGLQTERRYFVTLNMGSKIDPKKIFYQCSYTHPVYTPAAVKAQDGLRAINGISNTYYCGAYMRYGFHEDGVVSAMEAVKSLEVSA